MDCLLGKTMDNTIENDIIVHALIDLFIVCMVSCAVYPIHDLFNASKNAF